MNQALPLNRRAFLMALSANKWNAQRRHRRSRILDGVDGVSPVAVLTSRRQRIAPGDGFAVQAFPVQGLFIRVAGAAGYLRKSLRMRKLLAFKIGMAGNALQGTVD
jgi:hypothetical protein